MYESDCYEDGAEEYEPAAEQVEDVGGYGEQSIDYVVHNGEELAAS